ncbi:butyrophilin subfamily 1 member A1-like isoform X1 [Carettochelys insculpta]|uniref:butyrophilin subfamily 1 member A1-like isoform X1 n=1 Tax=Carettochelys insculpta TaxID=44489 RepID=UPI003EBDAB62
MTEMVPSFSPGSAVSSALRGYLALCLALQVPRLDSAQFTVIGPDHPVVALVGVEAVLPCHLSPNMSAETMEVRWFRSRYSSVVHLYGDGQDQYGEQMLEYRGRTELFKDDITSGRVSLRIRNIRLSDDGRYTCFFRSSDFYEEALLELQVAGLGPAPVISVEGHQEGGIRLVCRSSGWYPEPEAEWRDHQGQRLPSASETISPKDSGLFQTEIAIVIAEESNQKLSCCVRNHRVNQEKESAISLAELFFPRINPWLVALAVILPLLAVLISLASYCFWRQHRAKETLLSEHKREKETLLFEHKREKETLLSEHKREKETLLSEHRREKEKLQGELEWRRALLNAGWEKVRQYAVDVTLDPDTANPRLALSEDRKRVRDGGTWQSLPDNPERFENYIDVLGAERLTGGRSYWEVEVGDKTGWELGVCRESVRRKWWLTRTPGNGYWAVRLWDGEYSTCTSPLTPLPVSTRPGRVGIFLDYEAGEVSFYNVTDGSHLFTFTDTFSGPLRPFFCPGLNTGGTNAAPLIICPVPVQPQGISVPDRDPAAQTGPSQR